VEALPSKVTVEEALANLLKGILAMTKPRIPGSRDTQSAVLLYRMMSAGLHYKPLWYSYMARDIIRCRRMNRRKMK
jgi:hypothetical protein